MSAISEQTLTVKGSPVKSLLKFIDNELTSEQREKAFDAVPAEWGSRFRRGNVLVSETVPVSVLNTLTAAAAEARGETVDAFARRAGKFAASEAMSGVYRLFAMVLTPTALLAKASRIWSSLYSRGELRVASESSNSALVRLVDFPTEPAGCARITGWIERMTEMTGEKNTSVTQTSCYSKGAAGCEWEIRWGK